MLFDFKGYYDDQILSATQLASNIPEEERNSVWNYDTPPRFYLYTDIYPCYKYFVLQSFQSESNEYIKPGIQELLTDNPPTWIILNAAGTENEFVNSVVEEKYELVDTTDYGLKLSLYKLAVENTEE